MENLNGEQHNKTFEIYFFSYIHRIGFHSLSVVVPSILWRVICWEGEKQSWKKRFFWKILLIYLHCISFFLSFFEFQKKKEIFDKTSTYFGNIIIQYFLEYQELIQELFPKKNKMRLNSQNSREREREKKKSIYASLLIACLIGFLLFFLLYLVEWSKSEKKTLILSGWWWWWSWLFPQQ